MTRETEQCRGRTAVLGASGLVGSAIIARLHAKGHDVIAVVRNELSAAVMEAQLPGVPIRVGSVENAERVHTLIGDCSVVINCALAGSGGIPAQAYVRNRAIIDGIFSSTGARWLIHFSTVAVYGETIAGIEQDLRQFAKPRPDSEYGRSKLDVERYASRQARAHMASCTCLRLGHVYGPGVGRSREILKLSSMPNAALPFAGRYQANAIHLDSLASAIEALVATGYGPSVANLHESGRTWREVFDWHADGAGLNRIHDLGDAESLLGQRTHLDGSVARAAVRWTKNLPVGDLVRSPAVFDFVLRTLARTPPVLTRSAAIIGRRLKGRDRSRAPGADMLWPGVYYACAAPGPVLANAEFPTGDAETSRSRLEAFANWYKEITVPSLPSMPSTR